jgi:malonyl-CoA O-methyltransferase
VRVGALEGHRIWASSYDEGPNPLLALEARLIPDRVAPWQGSRFLDVACGTGRWMLLARERGAQALGVDFCPEMLREAARKPGLAGCVSLADAGHIPIADGACDLTLCSFGLGYMPSPDRTIGEMARATGRGGRVMITDLHPRALAAGWTRSFRLDDQVYEIEHQTHPVAAWEAAASASGLTLDWRLDACFAEPEREIFRQAGKDSRFDEVSRISALLAMCWTKP